MAETRISDLIVPEVFSQYVMDATIEKSMLVQSGVATVEPVLNTLISGGGKVIQMPHFNDLTGEEDVLAEGVAISVEKITASQEDAPILLRGKSWASTDLAGILTGTDPMGAIASRVADYWIRRENAMLLSILKGVTANASLADHVINAGKITGSIVIDGQQCLGDNMSALSMIYMHSATFSELKKQNMIEFIPQAESKVSIPTFLGLRVLVEDSAPVEKTTEGEVTTTTYTSYLLAGGAIRLGNGTPPQMVATETDRDSATGTDYLFNRQARVIHPNGLSWVGTPTGLTPTNAELETGTNWKLVKDLKKVGIVAIKHTL